jgi:RNA polymerase I-specific transcription initiation factor RRN5
MSSGAELDVDDDLHHITSSRQGSGSVLSGDAQDYSDTTGVEEPNGSQLSDEQRSPRQDTEEVSVDFQDEEHSESAGPDTFANASEGEVIDSGKEEIHSDYHEIDTSEHFVEAEISNGDQELQPKKAHKRKLESDLDPKAKRARLRVYYTDKYRQLLNVDIQDASLRTVHEDQWKLRASQIGSSIWTSEEKQAFFSALGRLGKDEVRGIAERIRTKSELEVRLYIQLLQERVVNKHLNEPRQQLLGLDDLPAAIQISEPCVEALEHAADALSLRQELHEQKKEISARGNCWLLTPTVNTWLADLTETEAEEELKSTLPAVLLLHLGTWLQLSERIFMNPAPPYDEDNWRNIAGPDELPSIRAAAFEDFHSIAVNVTKRLVSTVIYCATSRIRSTQAGAFVRRQDVTAAVEILGLKSNSSSFWAKCARRNHMRVFKTKKALSGADPMTYEEVEEQLTHEHPPRLQMLSDTAVDPSHDEQASSEDEFNLAVPEVVPEPNRTQEFLQSEREHENLFMEDNLIYNQRDRIIIEDNEPLNPSDSEFFDPNSRSRRVLNRLRFKKELEKARHKYTEAFDRQTSLHEEQRLWAILRLTPPYEIKPEDVSLPARPIQDRKVGDELKDWRDHLEYWSQWETMPTPIATNAFPDLLQHSRPTTRSTVSATEEGNVGTAPSMADDEDSISGASSDSESDIRSMSSSSSADNLSTLLEAGMLSDQEEYSRLSPILSTRPARRSARLRLRSSSRETSVKTESISDRSPSVDSFAFAQHGRGSKGKSITDEQKQKNGEKIAAHKRKQKEKEERKSERGREKEKKRKARRPSALQETAACTVEGCEKLGVDMSQYNLRVHMQSKHPEIDPRPKNHYAPINQSPENEHKVEDMDQDNGTFIGNSGEHTDIEMDDFEIERSLMGREASIEL